MTLIWWNCPCGFLSPAESSTLLTDMQMKFSPTITSYVCDFFFFCVPQEDGELKYIDTERKYSSSYLLYTYLREKCITWIQLSHLQLWQLHGSLVMLWWGGVFVIFVCSFSTYSYFTANNVYLSDFGPITALSRPPEQKPEMAGTAVKKQDMQTMYCKSYIL